VSIGRIEDFTYTRGLGKPNHSRRREGPIRTLFACICNAVTDDQVLSAIDLGAATVEAVGDATRAGTCCGGCRDHLEDLIAERCLACPLVKLQAA
jgi:bacterioferritin-associated ferredoxin